MRYLYFEHINTLNCSISNKIVGSNICSCIFSVYCTALPSCGIFKECIASYYQRTTIFVDCTTIICCRIACECVVSFTVKAPYFLYIAPPLTALLLMNLL